MATRTQLINGVLNTLRGSLGLGETPANSNHNKITVWYNKEVAKIGNGPWCEMTATWAMWTSSVKGLKIGRAYTVYGARDAQAGARGSSWHWGTKGMRAGDQIYYDWGGRKGSTSLVDHTGIVEKIIGDGTFYVLEGNTSGNKLARQRRDSKFVVGYIRFAWDRVATDKPAPAPKPVPKPKPIGSPNKNLVLKLQSLLEVKATGKWDKTTDIRARRLRNASRSKVGYPRNHQLPFDVKDVQHVIDIHVDGIWGPRSQFALLTWVKQFQLAVGVTVDGQWGPKTDNAFLSARTKNFNV
jgi:hypothetical protein